MPCDSVILNTVDLDLANEEILRAAVEALGGTFTSKREFYLKGERYGIEGGRLTGDETKVGQVADQIKQSYSREVVTRAAKRFGWRTQTASNGKITLKRGN